MVAGRDEVSEKTKNEVIELVKNIDDPVERAKKVKQLINQIFNFNKMLMMQKNALINHLSSYEILNDKDIDALVLISKRKFLEKGEFLIREGETCEEMSFVNSGFLHSYYMSKSLEKVTYCIVFPNDFVSAFSSFISNQKSPISIQALTKVEVQVLDKTKLKELINSNYNIHRFFSLLNENYLIKLENRFFQFQKDDAKSRYRELLKSHPEFILNIPAKLLASYLGITPRHLSRIRASKI